MSAGPSRNFFLLNSACKFWIKFAIYLFSLAILVGYMFTLYYLDNYSKLGFIIGIAIIVMDIFNFILYLSDIAGSALQIILLLLTNRVLMVCLGKALWVYGFMVLYIVYSLFFVIYALMTAFPMAKDVARKTQSHEMIKEYTSNYGDSPEVLLAVLTTIYMGTCFFI